MTNLQEAKLAREAEIAYSTMALVTDYDCWHPEHDSVTVEMIINNLNQNAQTAQQVIARVVEQLDVEPAPRLPSRAGDGDHHAARSDPGADEARPGADHREIHLLTGNRQPGTSLPRRRS